MHTQKSFKYGKKIRVIYPGDYYVSKDNEIISTVLGSCVAVCLHDPVRAISGMNHFMLPGNISSSNIRVDKSAKYGLTAIIELLTDMEKKGAVKKDIVAKIFGGGSVLEYLREGNNIPSDNVRVARVVMEMEDIEIVEMDVGGNFTRKVIMDAKTGIVYLRKSTKEQVLKMVGRKEMEHIKEMQTKS